MIIFPAIDIIDGRAVRLFKGDYDRMTVYDNDPAAVATRFSAAGASHLHLVDLEGAKDGNTPNLKTVEKIRKTSDMFIEIGGGIRNMKAVEKYLSIGVDRVILGTAALTDRAFLCNALERFGEKIAVGVDMKDGFAAIKGWVEKSETDGLQFCEELQSLGVSTVICTDISKDGAMQGTNLGLYEKLCSELSLNITASGGVSTLDDIKSLKKAGAYGAIIGKAYYTGAIDLTEALEAAK